MSPQLTFKPEPFSRFTPAPVDREFEFEGPATPVIYLDGFKIGNRPVVTFSEGLAGFESSIGVCFPSPNAFLTIQGHLLAEENGSRRAFTASDRSKWKPVSIVSRIYTRGGVKVGHSSFAPIGSDGRFGTESMLVIDPGTCKVQIRVALQLKSGKEITAEAVIQCSTLECFLPFIDSWENRREPWRTQPCRDAKSRLEFLSATRKMFQPPPRKDGTGPEPGWKHVFCQFLHRNADVCPLAEFASAQAAEIRRFENLSIGGKMVDLGHVLTGIEVGRKQKPDSVYPSAVVRDANAEAFTTWAGDLGSALEQFAEALVTGQKTSPSDEKLDLPYFLRGKAGEADLLGDVDGINLGVLYDENKSLADNLRSYYQAKPFRRFHDFLAFARDDSDNPFFTLARQSPPVLAQAGRLRAAGKIAMFARAYKMKRNLKLTSPQEIQVAHILDENSGEMNAVVDYFFAFLQNGLASER